MLSELQKAGCLPSQPLNTDTLTSLRVHVTSVSRTQHSFPPPSYHTLGPFTLCARADLTTLLSGLTVSAKTVRYYWARVTMCAKTVRYYWARVTVCAKTVRYYCQSHGKCQNGTILLPESRCVPKRYDITARVTVSAKTVRLPGQNH